MVNVEHILLKKISGLTFVRLQSQLDWSIFMSFWVILCGGLAAFKVSGDSV